MTNRKQLSVLLVLAFLILATGAAAIALPMAAANSTAGNAALDAPTYAEKVAPILNQNCVSCHRPGQIAPMSLLSYDEVRPWAKSIARNVADGSMPPWHASAGVGFANDRSLRDSEVDAIVSWAKAGAPAGDLTKAPAPPQFPESKWRLGEPDLIVTLEEVEVPAGGPDQFHDLIGKVGLPEDRWVTAVEILPGNAKVVHHVIAVAIKGFDVDPQQGWMGAWAAGTDPMVFPPGTGRLLEKGANIVADMHYHPTTTAEKDVTRIGLHFADAPPAKELTNVWVINDSFEIPAGAAGHEVRSEHTFWQSGKIMTLTPHMHYRGKDFRYVLTYPDGRQETLLEVDGYDFNWQTVYELEKPVSVPAGTHLECIAHYDNSAGNLANPDPTVNVTFGNESYDEMMIGFVDFIVDEGVKPLSPFELRGRKVTELAAQHPGDVYKVSGRKPEERDSIEAWAPLYLPKSGDGVFFLISDDQLRAAKVSEIVWNGSSFEAKVELPNTTLGLTGEIAADGKIDTQLHINEERSMAWDGERVGP